MTRHAATTRVPQVVLVAATIVGSWFGMQFVHEFGHVLGARLTGGRVARVVLSPLTISRTDVEPNPRPLLVAWAGPLVGVVAPLAGWAVADVARQSWAFLLRFFAGFCLVANGLYIGVGSLTGVGDCGEMLRHGSEPWQLWLFGAAAVLTGLGIWHRQSGHFGFGPSPQVVRPEIAYGCLTVALTLLAAGLAIDGR